MRRDLPFGTVTFLFTDIEGSTKHLHALGADAYAVALAEQRRVLREAFRSQGGVEVDTQGDAFFVAFPTAPGALTAAARAQEGLASGPIRVRMGVHTGTPTVTEEGYVGVDVHRAARIAACGHGSQVLVSSSTAALVGTDGLLDLGTHRLKDLSAPERIYQLGNDDFPPLKTLHQTNLPISPTPFLGREPELAQVRDLLSQSDVRLLTLIGPGGTGKTRLALQTAGVVADSYVHGVWWVPLAALRDPRLVLETAAHAVGARNGLAEYIADRSMLLLLDNFEQVSEAAADVASLLASCPNLDLLVTSREPLHVSGEQQYLVPPLRQEDGVALFVARARAIKPSFEADATVAEICDRLDDLPLALELAAAHVKTLSPASMLERLKRRLPLLTARARDLPERQRTLRATIQWSHDLLTPDEQRVFARLAVFSGGCTLDAVERVIGGDLETLTALVDKSVLRHRDGRFSMLETIHEYAAERLEASSEAEALRRRHAEHFLALAEEAEPRLTRGSPGEWLDLLEREHDNARTALGWLEGSGEMQAALRFAAALHKFWVVRGHLAEGMRHLARTLAADGRPTADRAKALTAAAANAARSGDPVMTGTWADEAVALNRVLGDALGVALSQSYRAMAAAQQRDWAKARAIIEDCVQAFQELGDEDNAQLATWVLAWMCRELGDHDRFRALTEENLRNARAAGYRRIEALSLSALAMLAVDEGRLRDGLLGLKEVYQIDRESGFRLQLARDLWLFARVRGGAGHWPVAARLFAKAEALREETGESVGSWAVIEAKRGETLAAIRAQLDDAAFIEAWQQGSALSLDDALALALDPAG